MMRFSLIFVASWLSAAETVISIPAGQGEFLWTETTFTAKGTARALKLDFRGRLENQTKQPWEHAKFCVKAFATSGDPIRLAQDDCLVTLTAFKLQPGGSLNFKHGPRVAIGSGKEQIIMARFEITISGGGQEPPNTRMLAASCDVVWSAIVPVVSKRGFMPESSDRAGGFMKLRYTRGATGFLGSKKEVNSLTEARSVIFNQYERFEISSGSISIVVDGDSCRAMMQFEYKGYKDGMGGKGWFALPSNGHLESSILDDLHSAVK